MTTVNKKSELVDFLVHDEKVASLCCLFYQCSRNILSVQPQMGENKKTPTKIKHLCFSVYYQCLTSKSLQEKLLLQDKHKLNIEYIRCL